MHRCVWPKTPLDIEYHDVEWGVPVHDEHKLFEFLILEGAQAGLSWQTILQKRLRYREVFDGFDPVEVARYDDAKVATLLADAGIVRNRLKIAAAINNAQRFLQVQSEFGSFDDYLWRFVDGRPIINHWRSHSEVPTKTPISDALSQDLGKRGFKFAGSTICYAMMQAIGMINDHTVDCYRHAELVALCGRTPGN
ncbi:MAG: DNA-3-methyladenine glycosylase I [Betaproteobacteria bacterium HGW-Betaproteobacteria-1]|jgi:DNA-3-methyladenine glycosylase I|nr:MAG: DNA-3-methyladenine glycosylase I [Betaproteobacteria bacterium HGW-Betaproteobacteria-1]